MRAIVKRPEPASLVEYRAAGNTSYNDYRYKDGVRMSLVTEQRGLSCYCLSPIRPEVAEMRIEHWHSQDNYPTEQLVYSNLLGACLGGEGQPRSLQYCDVYKGNRDLSRNPSNPLSQVEKLIRFEGSGRIFSDNLTFNGELENVLNLNVAFLKNRRKAVLDAFTGALSKRKGLPRKTLEKWLRDWNGESHAGELEPFCQVIVYWLKKRLARA